MQHQRFCPVVVLKVCTQGVTLASMSRRAAATLHDALMVVSEARTASSFALFLPANAHVTVP